MNWSSLVNKVLKPFNGQTLKIYTMSVLAVITGSLILLGVNTAVTITTEAPRITIGDNNVNPVVIVPNSGGEYPALAFCEDPMTKVTKIEELPGNVGGGLVYELLRIRDGSPELLTWNASDDGTRIGLLDYAGRGVADPMIIAHITPEVEECIKSKTGA